MPRVAQLEGIAIWMYFYDHNPPHFHAKQGDDEAMFAISGALLEGSLPSKARRRVQAWATRHQTELLANWELAIRGEPLNWIDD